MAARAQTPSHETYNGDRTPNPQSSGYGGTNFVPVAGKMPDMSPLAQSVQRTNSAYSYAPGDDRDADDRGSTIQQLEGAGLHRTASGSSKPGVSRSNTLQKKKSISRKSSLKRSGSRKSLAAGSIKGVQIDDRKRASGDEYNSVFYTPVPTTGTPTEILANRFQAWRKLLKDLIAYFREVQNSYEQKSKSLLKVSNVMNNLQSPQAFMTEGGLNDANLILSKFHRQSVLETNKARDIEADVVTQLVGLRADLSQKIKEIKSLSGDFKNSVDKEKDHTRKAVNTLQEALAAVDTDDHGATGKDDPYIVRLGVERQVERQIDEENYLHRAYLNLEGSGRELESIVVGEIQKAYNALAGIMKRGADEAYTTIDQLRSGPITLPKDSEWQEFVKKDPHFVSQDTPLRRVEEIEYPGRDHPAAAEVRAGMLERKSKYLKSYTPGWYVLSPTHLHEFKSADRIYSQPPVMSLLLSDQKLGSHSQPGSGSHKFMLKGRQTGSMHRGHSWVFRAESYDTMLAWYDDMRSLIEKSGEERNAFVRKHARSFSAGSHKGSDSGLEEDDEADEVPFAAKESLKSKAVEGDETATAKRPQPGGRFPSDLVINRHLQAPLSPSSGSSMADQDLSTAAGGLQNESGPTYFNNSHAEPGPTLATGTTHEKAPAYSPSTTSYQRQIPTDNPAPILSSSIPPAQASALPPSQDPFLGGESRPEPKMHDSHYGNWMAPAAAGTAIGAGGALAADRAMHKEPKTLREGLGDTADTEKTSVVVSEQATALPPLVSSFTSDRMTGEAGIPRSFQSTTALPTELTGSPPTAAAGSSQEEHTPYDTNPDGTVNAKRTGSMFPAVLRHNTDTSISNLHVPGEYPRGMSG